MNDDGWKHQRPPVTSGFEFWATALSFVALSYGLPGLLLSTAIPTGSIGNPLGDVSYLLFGVLQLGAVLSALTLWKRQRAVAEGLLVGLLLVFVLIPCIGGF